MTPVAASTATAGGAGEARGAGGPGGAGGPSGAGGAGEAASGGPAPARRGPGRPREEGLDERIVDATLELVDAGDRVTLARVVDLSGASRAAIYRRWSSLAELMAAALDRGREYGEIPLEGDLRENLRRALFDGVDSMRRGYSDQRFRQRLHLALTDRALQKAYWRAHVSRRRVAMHRALQAGVDRGVLRADLDIDASIDLINGVFYYQYVVRGASMAEPETLRRCRAAFDLAWEGMVADR